MIRLYFLLLPVIKKSFLWLVHELRFLQKIVIMKSLLIAATLTAIAGAGLILYLRRSDSSGTLDDTDQLVM